MLANKPFLFKIYLALAVIESAIVLAVLALIPSDSKNAIFLGYSASRLALLGVVAVVLLAFGAMLSRVMTSSFAAQKVIGLLDRFLSGKTNRAALTLLSVASIAACASILLVPMEKWGDAVYQVERLSPLLVWAIVLASQTLILYYVWMGGRPNWQNLAPWQGTLRIAAITGVLFLVLTILISWSRLGIEPDRSGWLSPGTPLLITQAFLAWTIGLAFILWGNSLAKWINRGSDSAVSFGRLDLIICIVLWLAAILVWWFEPLRDFSYFSPEPAPPNFEYYPYADARLYDLSAQGILIGIGRELGLFLRPLYVFFLALLHFLGGQQYERIIFLQIVVLALIPTLMFGLGTTLGNRPAGVIAALLAIFRERNSIALTNVIEVSHSKLLLSDVPALALLLLFLFVLLKWLDRSSHKHYLGMAAGASLGLLILIRNQAQLLIPIVLVIIVSILRSQWRGALQGTLVFLLGLFVVVSPWVWRNYQVSGHFFVEDTQHYSDFLASSYTHDPTSIQKLLGESSEAYYQRMQRQVIDFVIQYPGEVAHFYGSHFIHNEIESVLYLPMSLKLYDLRSYVKSMPFWKALQIDLSFGSAILFFLSLGLIVLGLGVAMDRVGAVALAPLLIHLGYSFSIVPARMSGWRFILPVDWVPMLYYAIGLAQVTVMGLAILSRPHTGLGRSPEAGQDVETPVGGHSRVKSMTVLAIFLTLGLSLPLAAQYVPVRYPKMTPEEIVRTDLPDGLKLSNGNVIDASELISFVETEDQAKILYGRALYPSYYEQGQYWGDENSLNTLTREYNRVQFFIMGPWRDDIFLPLASPPDVFPHATDVIVVGCFSESAVATRALAVILDKEIVLTASPWNGLTCAETK